MKTDRKKITTSYLILIFFTILSLLAYVIISKFQKSKTIALEPISINLLTSVHPNLPWNFKSIQKKVITKPGEVVTAEYIVENLGTEETTGIATFVYFPSEFGNYINKINCFCYDAQTLKPGQKNKFTLVLLIDPEATKDSKTKNIKEVSIQFTFFDYKEYKEKKN